MANNKVVYAGRVLIDLTEDTVERDKLAEGITAHNKKGETITGTATLLNAQPQVTVTPSDTEQIITPESPYNALSSVKVEASQGGSVELPDFADGIAYLVTGDCQARFFERDDLIEQYGEMIATKDITNANFMFQNCLNTEVIPFTINLFTGDWVDTTAMFSACENLLEAPHINGYSHNMYCMFEYCHNLQSLNGSFYEVAHDCTNNEAIFMDCLSLKNVNSEFLIITNPIEYTATYLSGGFWNCLSLRELVDLPLPIFETYGQLLEQNLFQETFENCASLERLVFRKNWENEDNYWYMRYQTLDLSTVGFITEDKITYFEEDYGFYNWNYMVRTQEEYVDALENAQGYGDELSRYYLAVGETYSRYNHDSAVETINSLPYTSWGDNTIIFTENAGSGTQGGAIGDLTEEEIAVALDKGWIVAFV